MADLNSRNWLVSPNKDVEDMWRDVQIQEKRSAVAAAKRSLDEYRQKIEDIEKGMMVDLNARIIMLNREIQMLEAAKKDGKLPPEANIVDIEVEN